MKPQIKIIAALVAAPIFLSAASADAGWMRKRYHIGSECTPVGTQTAGSVWVGAGGMTNASSTSARGFYCSLEHLTDNYWADDIAVYIRDQNFNSNAWCQVRAMNPYNLSYSWSSKLYTSGSNPSAQKLSFGFFNHANDTWFMACVLPPTYSGSRSSINMYYTTEFDGG